MGVPKFFRYISERYPCLSEVVREYQIPEFDNLYLDMNGIIHNCSHPDDENVHFRITEEQIFKDIFHYIEVLFRMIRPQKLFFMAVDGVAPRAKMNQQRGRRFRSAKDVENKEKEAAKKGEVLPTEARFDSNCITPGTVFMAKLHEQLKYFVVDKISNDVMWQNCKVILSGHETPGEGEHKIMDYIRYMRAQPGYDPNTRHCLYGLDADLIMLGLCTHEPHFSLLREEVKFGKKSTKRVTVPEEITFFLLHLSLMREYLELEFYDVKDSLKNFEFDIEKIIDDWVLLGFLVGNDFVPHLPDLHIINGALPLLYKIYKQVLPTLDGYLNENGQLNLPRFEKFMQELSIFDLNNFEDVRDDLLYMEAKTGRKQTAHSKVSRKPPEDVSNNIDSETRTVKDSGLAALIQEASDFADISSEEEEQFSETADALDDDEAFVNFKREYYQNKLEFDKVTPEVMRAQAEGYVRAIQWILNYYYNGCSSWSWYYPHHYAPYISDIKGFKNLDLKFDFGRPFLPFEQLLAVLPSASKNLLPTCYHKLMTDEQSLIKKYYPEEFQLDLNGKKQEWEAVVLVPFIDENLLLQAMNQCNDELTELEAERNKHGPMLIYTFTSNSSGPYFAPQYFPPVIPNYAEVKKMFYDDVLIPKEKLIKGAYPGAKTDVYYPGFPTMRHLKYKGELKKAQIKVFEHASRGENMVITLLPTNEISSGDMIPVDLLGESVFVKWPHLTEAKVTAISNSKRKYLNIGPSQYNVVDQVESVFQTSLEGTREYFKRRMGIEIGDTTILVYVQTLMGRKLIIDSNGELILEKQFTPNTSCYPLQSIVYNISAYDNYQTSYKDITDIFPKNSICLTLTNPYYGSKGIIQENRFKENGRIKIMVTVQDEPDFTSVEKYQSKIGNSYKTLYTIASQLSISNNMFSRITGSIFVRVPGPEATSTSLNIGLDLKLNKKNLETPGYTKKIGSIWHYSDKTADLVKSYCKNFPEVFESMRDFNFDDVDPETIFKENWEERLSALKNWLKSLPTYKMDRRICGSSVLEPDVVAQIENVVDKFKSNKIRNVTMQIKPNFLYRPEIQSGTLLPDPKMDVKLMDRIVNVRCGYSVPFGIKGTVTAILESLTDSDRDTMYDVVFDAPFKDGMKLSCSEGRGYRLPKYSFINISYGKRLMEEKTGKPDNVIAASQSKTTNKKYVNNDPKNDYYNPKQQQLGQQNSAFAQFSSLNISKRTDPYSNLFGQSQYQETSQGPSHKIPQVSNKPNQTNLGNYFLYNHPGNNTWSYSDNPFMANASESPSSKVEKVCSNSRTIEKKRGGEKNQTRSQGENSNVAQCSNTPQEAQNRQQAYTDFIRNHLKINGSSTESNNEKTSPQIKNTNKLPNEKVLENVLSPTKHTTQNKQENLTAVSFDQLSQIANAPASVRLLTYYQSNGLGLPRYQYFQTSSGLQAQLTLADGYVVIGKSAKTREAASENVASDVLDFFVKNKKHNQTNSQSGSKTKPGTSAVLNNSFVPLQAIKSHINKTSKQSSQSKKENVRNRENISEQRTVDQKVPNTAIMPQNRPKKERKTRIAANLFNKN